MHKNIFGQLSTSSKTNLPYLLLQALGRVAQSVQRLATGWTVRGSIPSGGEIFRTCPDRPSGPPSLLYNGYRVFPGGKERPGRDADPSPPSSAVVMKGQSYTSTPLWAVRPIQSLSACTRVTFTFTFTLQAKYPQNISCTKTNFLLCILPAKKCSNSVRQSEKFVVFALFKHKNLPQLLPPSTITCSSYNLHTHDLGVF